MGAIFSSAPTSAAADELAEDERKLEFADACLQKANAARDLGDYVGSLGWLEQSLLVRAEVLGHDVDVNYNQAYLANIIAIGETHLALRRFERALVYFLRAKAVLEPMMHLSGTKLSSAPMQYVNMTAGMALVLTAVARNNHKPTMDLLEGENPLRVAEQQLESAIVRVVAVEGMRAPLLVSMYHILARIYLMTNKRMSALRIMQRCLGLTLHISQTKKVFSFLSYTRNVLDAIKELTLVERVVTKLQQWARERLAHKKARRAMDAEAEEARAEAAEIAAAAASAHGGDGSATAAAAHAAAARSHRGKAAMDASWNAFMAVELQKQRFYSRQRVSPALIHEPQVYDGGFQQHQSQNAPVPSPALFCRDTSESDEIFSSHSFDHAAGAPRSGGTSVGGAGGAGHLRPPSASAASAMSSHTSRSSGGSRLSVDSSDPLDATSRSEPLGDNSEVLQQPPQEQQQSATVTISIPPPVRPGSAAASASSQPHQHIVRPSLRPGSAGAGGSGAEYGEYSGRAAQRDVE